MTDKLYRSESDRVLGGVCAGLAEFYDLDTTLVRLAFIAAIFLGFGSGPVIYLIAWLIIPTESEFEEESVDSTPD